MIHIFIEEIYGEALNILADSSIVVGSRFHANILGLVLGKTIIPLSYSKKTDNALKDIGYTENIIDIKNIEKWNIEEITEQNLITKYDITEQKKKALKHFEALDKIIGEN